MNITSVYRLQLTPQFTLSDASAIVPYLRELGIDAVYASPFFEARPGSTHGYDNTSPHRIREELGGEAGLEAFIAMLRECKMGLILDLVANHMAASEHNPWWVDVLMHGPSSDYAHFFDIDWDSHREELKGKVYLPILEGPLMRELEAGKIRLFQVGDHYQIEAGWQRLPLSPQSIDGDPFDCDLKKLLDKQHYRLAFWESGPQNINYRRFFDINDLAALRVEEKDVFDVFHKRVFELLQEGKIQGVRVDHPDGFWEPKIFFNRLREVGANYVVVEKILEREEEIRDDWDVDGTVGYEFLTMLSALFVDSRNEKAFEIIYRTYTETTVDPKQTLFEEKRLFALLYMRSEVDALVHRLFASINHPDFSQEALYEGVVDLLAAFPVYRTYIGVDDNELSEKDDYYIQEAFKNLTTYSKGVDVVALAYLKRWLTLQAGNRDEILRFQQLSAPIMAKGFEDTYLYVYNRFIALNEVGGDPHHFGATVAEFHEANQKRARGFLPCSTHDTKRSCDVRMRLSVLSEMPKAWQELLDNAPAPAHIDKNVLYFVFQTVVGMWPVEPLTAEEQAIARERLCDYLIKASREAKVHTNWVNHNTHFEHALTSFAREVVASEYFLPFIKQIHAYGMLNTYSALILQLGSPGVVDVYQGNELWDYSLVDPDNRRPVDFATRHTLLSQVKHIRDLDAWMENGLDGSLKLFLTWKGLQCRRTHPELFIDGEYVPLQVTGTHSHHVVAFMRKSGKKRAIVFALRFYTTLGDRFGDTKILLPEKLSLENIFTDETFEGSELLCSDICKTLPTGILLNLFLKG